MVAWHFVQVSPSVPAQWTPTACSQVQDGGMPSEVDVGAVARGGLGSRPVGRDWNVAAAAGTAAVKKGTGTAPTPGNGLDC